MLKQFSNVKGIEPVVVDKLKNLVTEVAMHMAVAVYFKIHAEILYGPELLSTFNGNRS